VRLVRQVELRAQFAAARDRRRGIRGMVTDNGPARSTSFPPVETPGRTPVLRHQRPPISPSLWKRSSTHLAASRTHSTSYWERHRRRHIRSLHDAASVPRLFVPRPARSDRNAPVASRSERVLNWRSSSRRPLVVVRTRPKDRSTQRLASLGSLTSALDLAIIPGRDAVRRWRRSLQSRPGGQLVVEQAAGEADLGVQKKRSPGRARRWRRWTRALFVRAAACRPARTRTAARCGCGRSRGALAFLLPQRPAARSAGSASACLLALRQERLACTTSGDLRGTAKPPCRSAATTDLAAPATAKTTVPIFRVDPLNIYFPPHHGLRRRTYTHQLTGRPSVQLLIPGLGIRRF